MNKRIAKKIHKQFNGNYLTARRNCIYCADWGCGCANGHPDVYPGDRSDYLYGGCKEKFGACNFLAKQLKKEGLSLSGWKLMEIPANHVYVFQNMKKHKDITITVESACYEISSTDMFWEFSEKYNAYAHNTLSEALKAPWQHWNFARLAHMKGNHEFNCCSR